MKIIRGFAIIENMSNIQNNTMTQKLPARFTRSPWLRKFAAATLGLTTATAGHMATDAISDGINCQRDTTAAMNTIMSMHNMDSAIILQPTKPNRDGIDNSLKLAMSDAIDKKFKMTRELMTSMKENDGFNYLAAVVGLATGVISALVAGKKLKAEQVVGNFKELCHALVQTSKDGEFSTPEGSYKIDFKSLFTNTIQGLIKDSISQDKNVRLAFLEHKRFFMQMLRNLTHQGKIDDAKLIVQNMPRLGISKADILSVLEEIKSSADDPKPHLTLPFPQRKKIIESISELLEILDDNGYLKHRGVERLRAAGVQVEETY